MSEEILENIETPIEEETQTETDNSNENEEIFEVPQRVNPFCVISKDTYGQYNVRDIQTNSSWSINPYENYAIVPDDMVLDIQETGGFCDIELNEVGTEVVNFTALEIPEIPQEEPKPTVEDRVVELEETVEILQEENLASAEMEAELLYDLSLLQLGVEE